MRCERPSGSKCWRWNSLRVRMGLEKGEKERRDKHILVARGERGRDISLARRQR